jgi:hypothetical protein
MSHSKLFLLYLPITALLPTLLCWYVGRNLLGPLAASRRLVYATIALVFPLGLSTVLALTFWSEQDRAPIRLLVSSGFLVLGALLTAAGLLLVRDLLRLGWWVARKWRNPVATADEPSVAGVFRGHMHGIAQRRLWVSSWIVLATTGVFLWLGRRGAEQVPVVHRVSIPIRSLPGAFTNYRIAQLTDIHLHGRVDVERAQRLVAQVNALDVDLLALTGDIVDGPLDNVHDTLLPLGDLRARDGVYVAMGNHENYADADACADEFRRLGFRVLLNEHRVVTRGLDRLVVAGVTNPQHGMHGAKYTTIQGRIGNLRSDAAAAIAGAPLDAPKVLLAHQPKSIADAKGLGFDLALAGHTHGGQFFPWSIGVGLIFPYSAGLYVDSGTQIYISPGVGTFGPPLRLGTTPEVAVLELTAIR